MLYKDFLKNITLCPFCDPSNRTILDTEETYLTYALAPYHKYHLLVIPKRHTRSFTDLSVKEMYAIDHLIKSGIQILYRLGYDDCTIILRDGNSKMRSLEHLHYHLIPEARIGDLTHEGKERRILEPKEIEAVLTEIRSCVR